MILHPSSAWRGARRPSLHLLHIQNVLFLFSNGFCSRVSMRSIVLPFETIWTWRRYSVGRFKVPMYDNVTDHITNRLPPLPRNLATSHSVLNQSVVIAWKFKLRFTRGLCGDRLKIVGGPENWDPTKWPRSSPCARTALKCFSTSPDRGKLTHALILRCCGLMTASKYVTRKIPPWPLLVSTSCIGIEGSLNLCCSAIQLVQTHRAKLIAFSNPAWWTLCKL